MESSLQLGKAFLAVSVFLAFVAWDVVKACKSGDKWVQGSALTLTALTVQFLGYFDAQNVNPSGKSKEKELQTLLNKQLSVDIARLVFCTFLGCVLPGVAFHGSEGMWSSIAAVAVSLCLHMATEVYVLRNVDHPTFRNGGGEMFISSSALLLIAAISLVLYLGLAVINCKFTRDRLSIKIPKMLSGRVQSELLHGMEDREAFKWWAVVRGCQHELWLVSSAFSPAVLMIVTTCVAVVVSKAISRQSLLHGNSISVKWTLCLQCVFILTGWIILFWRWLIFLFLCLARQSSIEFPFVKYSMVYEIRFSRLLYLFLRTKLSVRALDNLSHFKFIQTSVQILWRILAFSIFPPVILTMSLFSFVICLLMLFHFFVWFWSRLLLWIASNAARTIPCANRFKDLVSDTEVQLFTEANERVLVTESSNQETRRVMKDAYAKGQNSREKLSKVIQLSINESRETFINQLSQIKPGVKFYYQGAWKMAAVATISILAELAYDRDWNEIVKDAVQAYWEARDLLEFLDFPDNMTVNPFNLFGSGNTRTYKMSLEADSKMQKIERLVKMKRHHHQNVASTFDEVVKIVGKFAKKGEALNEHNNKFCQYWSGKRALDVLKYREGTCDLKRFSMKCACQAISKEPYSNERELVDRAVKCLGDIIAFAVVRVPQVLPEYCRKWAEEFKEENLIKALAIQEKLRAIKENWPTAQSEDKVAIDILGLQEVLTQCCWKWAGELKEEKLIQEKFKTIEEVLTSEIHHH